MIAWPVVWATVNRAKPGVVLAAVVALFVAVFLVERIMMHGYVLSAAWSAGHVELAPSKAAP